MNVWNNEGYKTANNAFGSSAYSTIKDHFPTSFFVSWSGCRCYRVVEICVVSALGNKHRRAGYCQSRELQGIHYENYKILWEAWGLVNPGFRAVGGVVLRPADCRGRGFESRWGHAFSSVVFVAFCVHSVRRPDQSFRGVMLCVWIVVIQKSQ